MLEVLREQIEPLVVHLPVEGSPLALVLGAVLKVVHVHHVDEGAHRRAVVGGDGVWNSSLFFCGKVINNCVSYPGGEAASCSWPRCGHRGKTVPGKITFSNHFPYFFSKKIITCPFAFLAPSCLATMSPPLSFNRTTLTRERREGSEDR